MKEYASEFSSVQAVIPNSFDKSGGLWLIRIGRNIAKPNYKAGPRQIHNYSMHFVKEGQVRFGYNDKEVILTKGDLFFHFPDTLYNYSVVSEEIPLEMAWIKFDGVQAPKLLLNLGVTKEAPFRKCAYDVTVDRVFNVLLELAEQNNFKKKIKLQGLLYMLFGELSPNVDPAEHAQTSFEEDWVQKGLDYIDSHYMEFITVADISEKIGIHRSHFTRLFTKAVGIPPLKYLLNLRLNHACELLLKTSLPISQISRSSGYPDLYTFSRVFTKLYGIPPSKYRIHPE